MKWITTSLLVSCCALFGATEEQLNRKFNVEPGGNLIVEVGFGSIEVSTHSSGEVVVEVFRKIGRRTTRAEEEFLKANPVEFSQDGSTVRVVSKDKSRTRWFFGGWSRNEGKYTITVPARFNVQLKTAGGGIEVRGMEGNTVAQTSGGGLRFERLRGALDGNTSGGGIRVGECTGDLKIHTSGGGIHVEAGGGSLKGQTSGGSVTVRNFDGPAQVETSGGGMTLERIGGKLQGSTSGGSIKAVVLAPLPGDVKLSTSGGGVTVVAPEDMACNLDASTSAGKVTSDLPVTILGKSERGELKGTINGGGPTMHLRSSAGGIKIEQL